MIGRRIAVVLGQAEHKLFPGAPVILIYHRVSDEARDFWGVTTSPERFAEQIEAVKSVRRIVPLSELAGAVGKRRSSDKPLAAITFDDGYQDVLTNAAPILERLDAPSTLFVVSGLVDQPREFWWDELAHILLECEGYPDELKLHYRTGPACWWTPSRRQLVGICHQLRHRFRRMAPDYIEEMIAQLRAWAKFPVAARPENRVVTSAQIAKMKGGLMSVGAHTAQHPSMPALAADAQAEEALASRRALEGFLGAPVEHFAYPFGDYNKASLAAAKAAGFKLACTTVPSTVKAWRDPLRLPRFNPRHMDGEALIKALG